MTTKSVAIKVRGSLVLLTHLEREPVRGSERDPERVFHVTGVPLQVRDTDVHAKFKRSLVKGDGREIPFASLSA
jgi:hypothetical protein